MFIPYYIIIPLVVSVVSQTVKFLLKSFDRKTREMEPNWRYLDDYGGMPSSHTAFMFSLMTIAILAEGIYSLSFAIAFVISVVIIRDALGYRMHLQHHAEVLNKLIKRLPENEQPEFPKHLEETVGHKPLEIIVGALIGIFITLLWWWIFPF